MTQISEDYISFETAKLLKGKGFEYNPDESYWLIDADNKMYWVSRIGAYDYVDVPTESFQRPKNGYRLVTQATAMKWLREVHHIFIRVIQSHIEYCTCEIYYDIVKYHQFRESFNSYEEACEAAIKYCLENLI